MESTLLRYYRTICETGNISKAAEELFISRQALSKAIIKLENELGLQLFERRKGGIELTRAGDILYRHSLILLDDYRRTTEELESLKTATRKRLHIGYAPISYNLWNTGHMEKFAHAHPEIDIRCDVERPLQLIQHLENRTLDLIITSFNQDPGNDTFSVLLKSLPYFFILRTNDPLSHKDRIEIEDLKDRSIFLRPIPDLFEKEKEFFRNEGIEAACLPSASLDPLTILRTIRYSGGIYFDSKLHFMYRNMMDGLTAIPFLYSGPQKSMTDEIIAVAHKERQNDPILRQYIRYLKDCIRS